MMFVHLIHKYLAEQQFCEMSKHGLTFENDIYILGFPNIHWRFFHSFKKYAKTIYSLFHDGGPYHIEVYYVEIKSIDLLRNGLVSTW